MNNKTSKIHLLGRLTVSADKKLPKLQRIILPFFQGEEFPFLGWLTLKNWGTISSEKSPAIFHSTRRNIPKYLNLSNTAVRTSNLKEHAVGLLSRDISTVFNKSHFYRGSR